MWESAASFYLGLMNSISCCVPNREYGTIDDVDIDLHINIGFLDVSQRYVSSIQSSSIFATIPTAFRAVNTTHL